MDLGPRKAASELALAYADVLHELARYELEGTITQAAHCARRLEVLAVRAAELKVALREELRGQIREAAA